MGVLVANKQTVAHGRNRRKKVSIEAVRDISRKPKALGGINASRLASDRKHRLKSGVKVAYGNLHAMK